MPEKVSATFGKMACWLVAIVDETISKWIFWVVSNKSRILYASV